MLCDEVHVRTWKAKGTREEPVRMIAAAQGRSALFAHALGLTSRSEKLSCLIIPEFVCFGQEAALNLPMCASAEHVQKLLVSLRRSRPESSTYGCSQPDPIMPNNSDAKASRHVRHRSGAGPKHCPQRSL